VSVCVIVCFSILCVQCPLCPLVSLVTIDSLLCNPWKKRILQYINSWPSKNNSAVVQFESNSHNFVFSSKVIGEFCCLQRVQERELVKNIQVGWEKRVFAWKYKCAVVNDREWCWMMRCGIEFKETVHCRIMLLQNRSVTAIDNLCVYVWMFVMCLNIYLTSCRAGNKSERDDGMIILNRLMWWSKV